MCAEHLRIFHQAYESNCTSLYPDFFSLLVVFRVVRESVELCDEREWLDPKVVVKVTFTHSSSG